MNILVTGGAGFIGSHIARHHLHKGDRVWVIDNLASGNEENLSPHPNLRFDQADIRVFEELQKAIEWSDRIYHMAATIGQRLVLAHTIETLSNNIDGLEVILKGMCKTKKETRLMVASTSGVYIHGADTSDGLLHETALLAVPSGEYLQETYRLSKMVNEVMTLAYVHQKKLPCTIVRIFNTIGIHQTGRYGMVVPTFVGQALRGKPITVFGNGQQRRAFCNVHDSVEAFDRLLQTPKSIGSIVNVGNHLESSILDLAKMIKARTKSSSEIVFVPYKEAYGVDFVDVQSRKPALDVLFKMTGFRPKWSLEETLDEVIDFERKKLTSES